MLRLFYSKGSSALAPHILLTEVGADFEAVEVSIPEGKHLKPDFLRRNPKGRVPVLETPDGNLTENPAILEYIAASYPSANYLPSGTFAQAQARSLAAYLCATAHVAFAHKQRGRRWARAQASLKDMQDLVPSNLEECAKFLEADLAFAPWALGATYCFCDPYLLLLERWLTAAGVDLDAYPRLAAHREAMLARPATQAVLSEHGLA